MSLQLINRSPDLKKLQDEGYHLQIKSGYLVVNDVPYVNGNREILTGTLVCQLSLGGDITIKPSTHVAQFKGQYPCLHNGTQQSTIVIGNQPNQDLGGGLLVDFTFSKKPLPLERGYLDYYEMVTAYVELLSNQAQAINPNVTAKTFPVIQATDQESVFCYIDSASSRAGISAVSVKLALDKIAIIGLGGSGAYILDLVAKTPVKEIHLFDGDVFSQHNAFRAPGAPSVEELRTKPNKVDYYARVYSNMHRGIKPHHGYIDSSNIEQLREMGFVFICLDQGAVKKVIIDKLEEFSVPFIDVGMGIYMEEVSKSIGGILRVTTSTDQQRNHIHDNNIISFGEVDGNNDYRQNIQIADLNALNATLAVIKWKKLFGFYLDFENEFDSTYTIDGNIMLNDYKIT